MENNISKLGEEYFGMDRGFFARLAPQIESNLKGRPVEAFYSYILKKYGRDKAGYARFLLSTEVWDGFDATWDNLKEAAELDCVLDFDQFEFRSNMGESPEEVLEAPCDAMSPLFRYLISLKFGLFEKAREFEPKALQQLAENPFYRDCYETLKQWMPK